MLTQHWAGEAGEEEEEEGEEEEGEQEEEGENRETIILSDEQGADLGLEPRTQR